MDKMKIAEAFKAAETGDTARLRDVLKTEPAIADSENENGLTLLGVAAHFGHKDAVQAILDHGADINALSHSRLSFIPSNTALHAAIAGNRSFEVVELLVKNGADVNGIDSVGHTPLQAAAFEGNTETALLLLNNGADSTKRGGHGTAVTIANKRGHHEFVALLLEHGAHE